MIDADDGDNDDEIPDGVAANDDDHDVDTHSGDQNLTLSNKFLKQRSEIEIWI